MLALSIDKRAEDVQAIARLRHDEAAWDARRHASLAQAAPATWERSARILIDELMIALA